MIVPVILSGGSGTRLWPVSNDDCPKQFHALAGDVSMFRQTIGRIADRTRFTAPVIVCGAGHVERVKADLSADGIDDATIIVEPGARNTAPAIALAALAADPGATLLVMPADHAMTAVPRFLDAIETALPSVREGALATFGIAPSYPETGYGYIAAGEAQPGRPAVRAVRRFVEKPERPAAEAMLKAGGHYWNAGIFLMRADRYLAELARQQPDILEACRRAMAKVHDDGTLLYPDAEGFLASPSNSIDYAVMESASQLIVVPVDPGWSDVGGWAALYELGAKDENGNVHLGDVVALDTHGNYVRAAPGKRVSIAGLSDLVVVFEGDDILILPRARAQDVRMIAQTRAKAGESGP